MSRPPARPPAADGGAGGVDDAAALGLSLVVEVCDTDPSSPPAMLLRTVLFGVVVRPGPPPYSLPHSRVLAPPPSISATLLSRMTIIIIIIIIIIIVGLVVRPGPPPNRRLMCDVM
jgi:hypothetical protein